MERVKTGTKRVRYGDPGTQRLQEQKKNQKKNDGVKLRYPLLLLSGTPNKKLLPSGAYPLTSDSPTEEEEGVEKDLISRTKI